MVLHAYRHPRLVVLGADTSVREAALAMETNEVGAIVVTDEDGIAGIVTDRDLALRVLGKGRSARRTTLAEVMTPGVWTLEPGDGEDDALRLMQERGVRRVPLVEKGRVVGMVTLDDLILERAAKLDDISAIVRAQIVEAGPARTRRFDEWRSLERRYARALSTWTGLVARLMETSELETRDRAARAIELVLGALVRRLDPTSAARLVARAPALVQARLRALPPGPDASVTRASLEREVAEALGLKRSRAAAIVEAAGALVARSVEPSDAAGRRLPPDLRALLRAGIEPPEPRSAGRAPRKHAPRATRA